MLAVYGFNIEIGALASTFQLCYWSTFFLSPALSYRWIINEFPNFVKTKDGRWFVSQVTGNLYLAKAEPNDTAKYYCFTTINLDISTKSTFSKDNQLTVLSDGMDSLQLHYITDLLVTTCSSTMEVCRSKSCLYLMT